MQKDISIYLVFSHIEITCCGFVLLLVKKVLTFASLNLVSVRLNQARFCDQFRDSALRLGHNSKQPLLRPLASLGSGNGDASEKVDVECCLWEILYLNNFESS